MRFLIILAVLLVGCDRLRMSSDDKKELKVGRYELKQLSNMRRDQYLIDTATGRLWTSLCGTKVDKNGFCEGPLVWAEEPVENLPPGR